MTPLLSNLLLTIPGLYSSALGLAGKDIYDERRVYSKIIKKGDIVFDIGANIGDFTTLFSQIAGRHGHIHSFEPLKPNLQKLKVACENRWVPKNIMIHPLALSNHQGTATMYAPYLETPEFNILAMASLKSHLGNRWSNIGSEQSFEVIVDRLDNYIKKIQVSKIDFIKMDLEGGEYDAIEGAKVTISQHKPLLQLEISCQMMEDFGKNVDDIFNLLESLGYTQHIGYQGTKLLSSKAVICETAKKESLNVIFYIPGKHEDRMSWVNY